MNKGIPLSQLASMIETAAEQQTDMLVPAQQMEVLPIETDDGNKLAVDVKGKCFLEPTPLAQRQMATALGIPATYWDRCLETSPELLAQNANHWLQRDGATRLVRTQDDHMRAYLSDRYKRLDNPMVLRQTLETIQSADTKVVALSSNVDNWGERMRLKIMFPEVYGEVRDGDTMRAGIEISNSETGGGAFSVRPFLFRDFCYNGMIFGRQAIPGMETLTRRHTGARMTELWADDTLEAEVELVARQTRDVVASMSSEESLTKLLEQCRRAAESAEAQDPEQTIQVLAKTYGLSDTERSKALVNFIQDDDMTLWGAANAVTKVANDHASYERSTELEALGSQLITMQMRDWDRIAVAA